ncbi:hypothetical protein FSP39_002563 [Pinctada imbricata]|uniref:Otopetrin-2 n=1 Tax=Pinctada imbricata TaxID=66713 RepID=A0AA89BZR0_PINIB|nr:hypothetical protein FSP39_002563 [Pinctada imbricata]
MVLRGFLKMVAAPFLAGTTRKDETHGLPDGSISTIVLGACLQTLTVISLILMYAKSQKPVVQMQEILWGFIALIQFIGLLSSIVLSCYAYKRRLSRNQDHNHTTGSQDLTLDGLKLIFVWIFGISGILQFSFIATVNIYCLSTDQASETIEGISLASNINTILFYAMQIGFITYFHKLKLESSTIVNYTMMLILTATIVEYINAVLSNGLLDHLPVNASSNTYNGTDKCYWTSPIRSFFLNIYPYIVPAKIEFSLLSFACLLKIWCNCKSFLENDVGDDLNELTEYDRLLSRHSLQSYQTLPDSHHDRTSDSARPVSFYVTLIIGALFLASMVVISCLVLYVGKSHHSWYDLWEGLRIATEGILFILIMITFYHISSEGYQNCVTGGLNSDELILVFTSCATIGLNFIGIYSAYMSINHLDGSDPELVRCLIVECVLSTINIYMQTVLIIQGNKVGPNFTRSNSVVRVENLFMLLSMLNMAMWVILTLTSSELNLLTPTQQKFFGENVWKIIAHGFVPLFLYFRFQSALDLYNLFCKFK